MQSSAILYNVMCDSLSRYILPILIITHTCKTTVTVEGKTGNEISDK